MSAKAKPGKRYSINDFMELCSKMSYKQYIFSTKNMNSEVITWCATISFPELFCSLSPNAVCLIGDIGSIKFNNVKYIIDKSGSKDSWDTYEIICIDSVKGGETGFVILADK